MTDREKDWSFESIDGLTFTDCDLQILEIGNEDREIFIYREALNN